MDLCILSKYELPSVSSQFLALNVPIYGHRNIFENLLTLILRVGGGGGRGGQISANKMS